MASDKAALDGVERKTADVNNNEVVDEKAAFDIQAAPALSDGEGPDKDADDEDAIIVTGYDAAQHLLSLRDDFEPALTFRSIFLASCLSAFQAVMNQIYSVSNNNKYFAETCYS
jgi:hypothetical protein